jgi:hypothetical protein
METQKQLTVRSVLDAWNSRIEAADKLFNALTDEQLEQEISPGRNRGIYLLGHLTLVHDKMLPLLGFGKQEYSHLDDAFINKPDRSVSTIPSTKELRTNWKNINDKLSKHLNSLSPDQWFEPHTSVTPEDFAKEPHRNRLNVVLGRTNHLQYHIGQAALLKK